MAFQYIIKSGRHICYPFPLFRTRTISLMPSLMVARFSPSFYHQRGLSPSKTKRKDDGESEIYKSVWHQLPKCRLPFLLFSYSGEAWWSHIQRSNARWIRGGTSVNYKNPMNHEFADFEDGICLFKNMFRWCLKSKASPALKAEILDESLG